MTEYIFDSDLESGQLLLDKGAGINAKYGELGFYPVYSALNTNNPYILKFVIQNGADVNIEQGLPLFEAIDSAIDGMRQNNLEFPDANSMEMIKILLDNAADPELKDNSNKRPINALRHYANGNTERLELLKTFFRPLFPNIDTLLSH